MIRGDLIAPSPWEVSSMAAPRQPSVQLSPFDATLDASAVPGSGAAASPKVHVAEGSECLTSQTHSLLGYRLRAAAMCIFAGSLTFLIWNQISKPFDLSGVADLEAERQ